jgi:hypothetical protein
MRNPRQDTLEICSACRTPFLVPDAVLDLVPAGYLVEIACRNCGWRGFEVHDDAGLEALDQALDRSTAQLQQALDVLETIVEMERIDAFAEALHGDLILPEDF